MQSRLGNTPEALQYFVAIADELERPVEFTNLTSSVYNQKDPFPLGTRLIGDHIISVAQDIMTVPDILINDKVAKVLSEYVQEAIFTIGYNYVQLVPAQISPEPYYLLHVMKIIPCLNSGESSFSKPIDGMAYVERLSLDRSVLAKIPVQERLVFRLQELPRIILFEEGLVDAIARVHPKGCYFVPVEEWRTDYRGLDPEDDDDYEFDGT